MRIVVCRSMARRDSSPPRGGSRCPPAALAFKTQSSRLPRIPQGPNPQRTPKSPPTPFCGFIGPPRTAVGFRCRQRARHTSFTAPASAPSPSCPSRCRTTAASRCTRLAFHPRPGPGCHPGPAATPERAARPPPERAGARRTSHRHTSRCAFGRALTWLGGQLLPTDLTAKIPRRPLLLDPETDPVEAPLATMLSAGRALLVSAWDVSGLHGAGLVDVDTHHKHG